MVWGIGDYKNDREDANLSSTVLMRTELLASFMNFWVKHYPDAITGWNTEFFDIPFLVNRVTKVLGEDRAEEFSPWGNVSSRSVYSHGRPQQVYDIQGVANLDYLQLYQVYLLLTRVLST